MPQGASPRPAALLLMNFSDLQERLGLGVLRSDLAPSYGEFINEALLEIQNRRSWTFMKVTELVALGPGDGYETATLVANFKELRREPAINFIADDGGKIPATVVFQEEEIFRTWAWSGMPMIIWPPRVTLMRGATSTKVGVVAPLIETFNLEVNMFAYLPALVNPTDTSPFITAYPMMVLAKSKAIAFSTINDPAADLFEAEFERKFRAAAYQDAYSEVAGRSLNMGKGPYA